MFKSLLNSFSDKLHQHTFWSNLLNLVLLGSENGWEDIEVAQVEDGKDWTNGVLLRMEDLSLRTIFFGGKYV